MHRSCGQRSIQATLVDVQRPLSTTIVNPRPPPVVGVEEAEAEAEAEEVMAAAEEEEGAGTMEEKGDLAAEEHHHQATADRPSPVLSFYVMVSSISP
jgi:hypothetical protein